MLKIIKGIAALLLLVSLCLPLSQCTQQPLPSVQDQTVVVYQYYAIQDDNYWGYFPAIPFVLPLLMVLFNFKVKREKLRYELIDVILGLLVLLLVLLHAFVAKLVMGGYLALFAASAYLLASMAESAKTISFRYKNRR
jgi:hypothetical protein